MPLPPQNALSWNIAVTLIEVLSIGSTIIRLTHRWRTSRMWWDDWVTVVPLFGACLECITMWLGTELPSHSTNVFLSAWFATFLWFIVVWVSRVSLALSLARIFPPNNVCRRYAFGLAAVFVLLCLTGVFLSFGECYSSSPTWYNRIFSQCAKEKKVTAASLYATIILEFFSDLLLVISPLTLLWKVKLPTTQRRLVLVLFSSSILTLLASATFFTTMFLNYKLGSDFPLIIGATARLQAAVSLLVCNLLIVIMLFYRIIRRRELVLNHDDEPSSTSLPSANRPENPDSILNQLSTDGARARQPSRLVNTISTPARSSPFGGTSMTFTSISDNPTQQSSIQHYSNSNETRTDSRSFPSYSTQELMGASSQLPPWSFDQTKHTTASGSGS